MKLLTKQDSKVVSDFQKHASYPLIKGMYIIIGVMAVIGIIQLILKMYYNFIATMIIAIIFRIVLPYSINKANEKYNKSNKAMSENYVIEYEFLETNFNVKSFKNNEQVEFFKHEYTHIHKVEETPDYIFMYIAVNIAHCIAKEDLEESDLDNLRGILQSNCAKYKILKK